MAVLPVGKDGLLGTPVVTEFSFAEGRGGPFSFVFANPHTVVVVHANTQNIASYRINHDNHLTLLSGPFPTGDFAPCWLDRTERFVYTASFGAVSLLTGGPDNNGLLDGFRLKHDGTLEPLTDVAVEYPDPGADRSGNHGIDVRVIGRFLYFVQPRVGMVGRLTINANGSLTNLVNFGGLAPGVEPFAGNNPGINAFKERCFLQDPIVSPECLLGSAQGIAGF
jgi:6-phosphogluconolactonase (cycloisomerase 2 family)